MMRVAKLRFDLLLLPILVAALLIRVYGLGAYSLDVDEIEQVVAGQGSLWNTITRSAAHVASTPLDYLATHAMLQIGSSETLLRLPALLLGVASVALIYLLGRDLGTRWAGILAALMLTLVPLHIQYSGIARFYSSAVFFSLLSTWLLVRAQRRRRLLDWAFYGAAVTLGLYAHYYMAILVVIHGLWMLYNGLTKAAPWSEFWRFLTMAAAAGALFLPWVYYDNLATARGFTLALQDREFRLCGEKIHLLALPFAYFSTSRCNLEGVIEGPLWVLAFTVWGLFAVGVLLFLLQPSRRQDRLLILLIPLIGLPAIWVLDFLADYPVSNRQMLILMPYLLLGASLASVDLLQRVPSRYAVATGTLALSLLAVWAVQGEIRTLYRIRTQEAGLREMAQFLSTTMPPGDLLVDASPQYIQFYAPDLAARQMTWQQLDNQMPPLLAEHGRVWLLPWMPDFSEKETQDQFSVYGEDHAGWNLSPFPNWELWVLSAQDGDAGLALAKTLLAQDALDEQQKVAMVTTIGDGLLERGRTDEGIALMEPFLSSRWAAAEFKLALVKLYRQQSGETWAAKSKQTLEQILANEPDNFEAKMHLAFIYAEAGDWQTTRTLAQELAPWVTRGTYRDAMITELQLQAGLGLGESEVVCELWQEVTEKAEESAQFRRLARRRMGEVEASGFCVMEAASSEPG